MASFFRRNKPEDSPQQPRRGFTAEELAAAFPSALRDAPARTDDDTAATTGAPSVESTAPRPAPRLPADRAVPVVAPDTPDPTAIPAGAEAPTAAMPEAAAASARAAAPEQATPAAATPALPPTSPGVDRPASAPTPLAAVPAAPPAPAVDPASAASPDAFIAAMASRPLPAPAAPGAGGWRERLRGTGFARSLGGLFSGNPRLDDDLLDEIETALLTADVGVTASTVLVEGMRKRMKAREFADANALLAALRTELVTMLQPVARPLEIDRNARPFVILTVGVNGVGKTTTIGKLAHRYKSAGHSLMLAAGDTFRAAAVAQLQAWGDRNDVQVIAQGQEADPAAVAFDALQAAKARGTDVLIADTAGRLHTQQGLMAELGKIRRVMAKVDASAPHEVLMVVDGTTGQNAISQLRQFHAAVNVTGLVVTKLDGTAKGGVVFALAREFGIPIRYAGIGERPEDLRVFDAQAFVDALLPESLGSEGSATQ
ncbi:signal recognition particle-docking protein FtsY [Luteimonas yindakuii]|uniref:signal recognition particle-docking protein FtsY n=1 Tax=Luteimonas yindakuii TaxID=2565782 RepID=UPI0010A476E3|nr:signal recognition particle-docking protein FtsY [Luteimonas yindakuii]QCO67402.1 signal recognition particle-docking protein FtsY [Luteimonas yindakuii]